MTAAAMMWVSIRVTLEPAVASTIRSGTSDITVKPTAVRVNVRCGKWAQRATTRVRTRPHNVPTRVS